MKPEPFGAIVCEYLKNGTGGAAMSSPIGACELARSGIPPLRHDPLLRRELTLIERVARLAKRKAVAPAAREEEREAAEVLSIRLAMSRPIVVAERRVAAAVDSSPAALAFRVPRRDPGGRRAPQSPR